jgi:hypothetical protein
MLNSGEKKLALCPTKKINILTLVLSEKYFLNETTKNHNPLLKVKWSVPYRYRIDGVMVTVLVLSVVVHGFNLRSGQTKDYEIYVLPLR